MVVHFYHNENNNESSAHEGKKPDASWPEETEATDDSFISN